MRLETAVNMEIAVNDRVQKGTVEDAGLRKCERPKGDKVRCRVTAFAVVDDLDLEIGPGEGALESFPRGARKNGDVSELDIANVDFAVQELPGAVLVVDLSFDGVVRGVGVVV